MAQEIRDAADRISKGISRGDVAIATVIGIFVLIGLSEAIFISQNGMDHPVVQEMVQDYHQIIILAAGVGLVFLGLRSKTPSAGRPTG